MTLTRNGTTYPRIVVMGEVDFLDFIEDSGDPNRIGLDSVSRWTRNARRPGGTAIWLKGVTSPIWAAHPVEDFMALGIPEDEIIEDEA